MHNFKASSVEFNLLVVLHNSVFQNFEGKAELMDSMIVFQVYGSSARRVFRTMLFVACSMCSCYCFISEYVHCLMMAYNIEV